jgi:hypothetical protein
MRNITLIMLRMHPTPQETRATAGITRAVHGCHGARQGPSTGRCAAPHPDLRSPIDRKVIGGISRYARADCHGLSRRGADYADR